jgi:hypothetical protein
MRSVNAQAIIADKSLSKERAINYRGPMFRI